MPRGDKLAYTDKKKRQAEHIEASYEQHGIAGKEAKARAWATVNKISGGGKQSGSGRRPAAGAKVAAKKAASRTTVVKKSSAGKIASK